MIITATDFQLSVNEYFTKLMQGEEIIIERYGKKFAVLIPYDEYVSKANQKETPRESTQPQKIVNLSKTEDGERPTQGLSNVEVIKLLKRLLADA
jgi:PHD/YefM family antitoxin component YafN of YafNO toxin-antitoxin module